MYCVVTEKVCIEREKREREREREIGIVFVDCREIERVFMCREIERVCM